MTGLSKRFYIMMTRHDRGAFVEKVDFIAGVGHLDGADSRAKAGLPSGGPRLVVTPLGVFDFDSPSKAMRVRSLHPGVTLEEAQDATGFDLAVADSIATTDIPSDEELFVLRHSVDRTGVLPTKFPWPSTRGDR